MRPATSIMKMAWSGRFSSSRRRLSSLEAKARLRTAAPALSAKLGAAADTMKAVTSRNEPF